ncbi:acyl--CoA ligase, partial [Rhodopseudomonas pseudopalustris]
MPDFITLDALVRNTAQARPDRIAVIDGERKLRYAEFDALIDRIAAALQRDGVKPTDAISICALSSIEYAATFLGALRVGVAVAPLAPSSTAQD